MNVEQRRLFVVGQGETITLEAFLERQRTKQQEVAQVCRPHTKNSSYSRLVCWNVAACFVLGAPLAPAERTVSGERGGGLPFPRRELTQKVTPIKTLRSDCCAGTFSAGKSSSLLIWVPSLVAFPSSTLKLFLR